MKGEKNYISTILGINLQLKKQGAQPKKFFMQCFLILL